MHEVKGRVLDAGLGAGRHSLYLQDKGFEVIGIDTSPLALEVSRLRGVKDCRLMSLHRLDFPPNSFDTVLLLGCNFGLGDAEDIRSYLRKLYDVVTPEGIIIGECKDPSATHNPVQLAYHEMNRRRGLPIGLVKVRIGFRGEVGEWFHLFLMDQRVLEDVIGPT